MYQDEELHSQLMDAFKEYFKANQRWLAEGTKRAGMDVRFWMSEIRRICSARRIHVQEWRKWKDVDWEKQKAKRKAQKAAREGTDSDN